MSTSLPPIPGDPEAGPYRTSPIWVNLGIVTAGVVTGIAAWKHRKDPLGQVFLGAGGSLAAVGLAFFVRELFV